MRKLLAAMLVLGILLLGSLVVSADPGTLPGTETIQTVISNPGGK